MLAGITLCNVYMYLFQPCVMYKHISAVRQEWYSKREDCFHQAIPHQVVHALLMPLYVVTHTSNRRDRNYRVAQRWKVGTTVDWTGLLDYWTHLSPQKMHSAQAARAWSAVK